MTGRHVSPRRCVIVWRMHEGGASREATNDVLKKRFGEDQWVRYTTYYNII